MAKINEIEVNEFNFEEQATAPGTPNTGTVVIYAKTDGKMYFKDDAGTETEMGGGVGDVSKLTTTKTVTVGSGGDYATINAAIAAESALYPTYVSASVQPKVTINLLTGFVMAEQVIVEGIDLSWMEITSVDAEVSITRSALTTASASGHFPAFCAQYGGALPVISALFNMDTSGTATNRDGIELYSNSRCVVTSGNGVKNAGSSGILADQASIADVNDSIFTGAGLVGVFASEASIISAKGVDVSNSSLYGAFASKASMIDCATATGTNCTTTGFIAGENSNMNASNTDSTGAGTNGIAVAQGSTIAASGATGTLSQTAQTVTSSGIIFQ